jgi:hypothetical protein
MVMSSNAAERVVYIDVDERYPDQWRKEPYYSELMLISRSARVSIKCGSKHVLLGPGVGVAPKKPFEDQRGGNALTLV